MIELGRSVYIAAWASCAFDALCARGGKLARRAADRWANSCEIALFRFSGRGRGEGDFLRASFLELSVVIRHQEFVADLVLFPNMH